MSKHIQLGHGGSSPIIFKSGEPVPVICVAATFTGLTYANNGGNVQITSAGVHGLTTSPAVGASVYVSWVGGTGTSGLYTVLSVDDVAKITINLTHSEGLGTPTVAVANTAIVAASINIPALRKNSIIHYESIATYPSSANLKSIFFKLQGLNIVERYASTSVLTWSIGKTVNQNATDKQITTTQTSPGSVATSVITRRAIDTSIPTTATITLSSAAANEVLILEGYIVEVFI